MQSEFEEELARTTDSEEEFEIQTRRVVIFDWDNTLFCTSYLEMFQLDFKSIFNETKSLEEYLTHEIQSLEENILNLFEELIEDKVKIFIVTNADLKWIENCLNHFMPELKQCVEENAVKVYSAKTLFGKTLPIEKWKSRCFKKLLLENFPGKNEKLKILTIGDSAHEKLAALSLKSLKFYHKLEVKFVELNKTPNIEILKNQFTEISKKLESLFDSGQFYHKLSSV